MQRFAVFLIAATLLGATAANAARDIESQWLALIIQDLHEEIESGCEYSFDEVSDKWIALTGARFETWHFTVCGNPVKFSVRYHPKDADSSEHWTVEIERIASP